jgi:pimeloyl-ACP methyl ester carboxylesterase
MEDALIQFATAQWIAKERPDWTHAFLENIGHVPMLEAPDTVVRVIETWESSVLAS